MILRKFSYILFFLWLLLLVFNVLAKGNGDLPRKVAGNGVLFRENLDLAYREIPGLLKEAYLTHDSISQLVLIDRKCRYFYAKSQYDSLNETSLLLLKLAEFYSENYFHATGYMFQAECFSVNKLYDRALSNLTKAYNILKKDKSGDSRIFLAKANVLNSFANTYNDKGEPEKAVEKIKEVIGSYNSLKNLDEMIHFQYLNYSNLAVLYTQFNIDSAEYYANKSIAIKPPGLGEDKVMITNYYVLGNVYKSKNNYFVAASYYRKAIEASVISGTSLFLPEIYKNLIDIYEKEKNQDSVLVYENKLKDMELNILQSKYNSLQKTFVKDDQKKTNPYLIILITGITVIIVITGFFIGRKLSRKSQHVESVSNETYNSLLQLLKENDAGFSFAFEQAFPDFTEKLLAINSSLARSEVEFCFLLKLKLTTKEIAQLTYIEPRTVQNKKHRIRKRLDIPSSADIYVWLDSI